MSIEVISPGLQTSIQDLGRQGHMHLGVAKSGAMDNLSMQLANWLVGNALEHPVFEICLLGPTLRFTQALTIAICGAKFDIYLASEDRKRIAVNTNQSIQVKAGDTLHFTQRLQGARAYLAFAATLDCAPVLNSYSTHFAAQFAGFKGRALQKGDRVILSHCEVRKIKTLPKVLQQHYSGSYLLRCVPSVETEHFSEAQLTQFYSSTYVLRSDSNRMGLRFDAKPLTKLNMQELVSSGLTQGSVQIPPSGLPIISSVDGQTIGGYSRIANVISADHFALGQLVAGDKVNFTLLSQQDAQDIYARQYMALKALSSS